MTGGGRLGRQATERGNRRREAILAAATELLEEEGFAAVAHRAVAHRAGVPLASTTYYFGSREQLVGEALERLGERYMTGARSLARQTPPPRAGLGSHIVAMIAGVGHEASRANLLTFYERYIQAARAPALAVVVRKQTDELIELVALVLARCAVDDAGLARRIVALVDGLLLAALVSDKADPRDGVAREIDAVIGPAGRADRRDG